ncbi:MAG: DUF3025 domain-containing protein [Thiobacillus sp.]|nr:DUF3025 domain-containing protein [Thiobacillus sp.]
MSFDHPAFTPYRALIHELALASALPSLDRLNMLATALGTTQAHGLPLQFIAPDGRLSAREYETHILQTGQVPTRPDTWHDVLNALVWLRFPRFKSALNVAHGEALITEIDNQRGRRRDAMTVLDESGVWVISQDPHLPELLTACAWQTLFCERRPDVESMMRFVVVGHALLEKALAPYPSMTGKCLMLNSPTLDPDSVEQQAVSSLRLIESPRQLPPLPIQGIPGWDAENTVNAYYANQKIFRPRGAVL